MHESVLVREVVRYFKDKRSGVFLDGTLGSGGHALALLDYFQGDCRIIGIDRDEEAIRRSQERLRVYAEHVTITQSDFAHLDEVLEKNGVSYVDGCLLDVGVSKDQLTDGARGFSFRADGPLDMRMDRRQTTSAFDLVNTAREEELADIIFQYGEERNARRIARAIVHERAYKPLRTTQELGTLIARVYGSRSYYRIHPATRTFQALRIAVNNELEQLREGLGKVITHMAPQGIVCVITFHSLEDRIVKQTFRTWHEHGMVEVLTKKPCVPGHDEIERNPQSRSAKLRVAQRR